jgi:TRAP-type C4-dicarboxylate transport system permease small subunit
MWLKRAEELMERVTRPVVSLLKIIAMGILFLMMLLTATDVIGRYVFNRPLTGAVEIVEFMMAVMVSFGIAYCAMIGGHVSVDIVVMHFSKKTQAIIESITSCAALVFFILITWQNVIYIEDNYLSKLKTPVLHIAVYPFVALVAIGLAALCLVLLLLFIRNLSAAVAK